MSEAVNESKFNQVLAARKKSKAIRYLFYFIIFVLVVLSIETTIIEDTDWERIGSLGSVIKALARFLPPDFSLFTQLVKPTIETFMIACLTSSTVAKLPRIHLPRSALAINLPGTAVWYLLPGNQRNSTDKPASFMPSMIAAWSPKASRARKPYLEVQVIPFNPLAFWLV